MSTVELYLKDIMCSWMYMSGYSFSAISKPISEKLETPQMSKIKEKLE